VDVIAILNPVSSSYCFLSNKRVLERGAALKFHEFIPYDRAVTMKITVLKASEREREEEEEKESLLHESSNNNIPGAKRKISQRRTGNSSEREMII